MKLDSCIAGFVIVPCFVYKLPCKNRYMFSYTIHPQKKGLHRPPLLLRLNGGNAHAWKECRT